MGIPNIETVLHFKKSLNNQIDYLTESEAYILIAIYSMNRTGLRSSGNTLSKYLSELYHTPNRKKMFAILNKIKDTKYGFICETGSRCGKNYVVTERGKQYLRALARTLETISC